MSSQYHIRIRGRVHGPFELPKLRQLVRKGQLGRMHEISEDGHTWAPASTIGELFQSEESTAKATSSVETESADRRPSVNGPPEAKSGEWFYSLGDGSLGPCSFSDIKALAVNGRLGPEDKIWMPDRSEWIEASEVRELDFGQTHRSRGRSIDLSDASTSDTSGLSRIGDAISAANGWKLFVSLWCILLGISNVILGLVGLRASGLSESLGPGAIGLLLNGMFFGLVGALLLNAHSHIAAAAIAPTSDSIRSALQAEGRFWATVGLGLLLFTILGILGAVAFSYLPQVSR